MVSVPCGMVSVPCGMVSVSCRMIVAPHGRISFHQARKISNQEKRYFRSQKKVFAWEKASLSCGGVVFGDGTRFVLRMGAAESKVMGELHYRLPTNAEEWGRGRCFSACRDPVYLRFRKDFLCGKQFVGNNLGF
jgi:hypothetical protein